MREHISTLFYKKSGHRLLRCVLAPLGTAYGTLTGLRRQLYRTGLLRTGELPVPVISVGNLTVGGTGKTPLVMFLARLLQDTGHAPGIITRGYGGRSVPGTVVSDRNSILLDDAGLTGDEPLLLARQLPGVPVIIHPVRHRGGTLAVERFGCDCLLLDDGYQHLAQARDLDILVFDATAPLGNGRMLPAGPLREPLRAAERADLFIFTKVNQATTDRSAMQDIIARFPPVPYAACAYIPGRLTRSADGTSVAPESLKGKTVISVTGLARPESFISSVGSLGIAITGTRLFPDHHSFSPKEAADILDGIAPDACIITSAKDAVRMPPALRRDPRVCILELRLDFGDTLPAVRNMLNGLFPAAPAEPGKFS